MIGAHSLYVYYPLANLTAGAARSCSEPIPVTDSADNFDALMRPQLDKLYRLGFRLTGERADAEDLVQDVLIKAYERRDELTSIAALGAWLARVLYNQFIDKQRQYARRRLRSVPLDDETVPQRDHDQHAPTPEQQATLQFDITRLNKALAELSLEHRAVLLMHDSEGYKLHEIQTITGVSLGTLKSRLHRARARLRELLKADGTF